MDDPLLMRVLHGLANRDSELEPLSRRQSSFVAESSDRDALDQLHHEVGPAGVGGAGVEDPGDVRVVHQGQGLALGAEPRQHLPRVHAGLDELECDGAPHRLGLLRHVDRAHTPLTDGLQELVRADDDAWAFTIGLIPGRVGPGNTLEEAPRPVVRFEQQFNTMAQLGVMGTNLIQVSSAFFGRLLLDSSHEDRFFVHLVTPLVALACTPLYKTVRPLRGNDPTGAKRTPERLPPRLDFAFRR